MIKYNRKESGIYLSRVFMKYSKQEVLQFVAEEDVKFIRLAFCDVFGKQKNISIMPDELSRAFEFGISFDASAIDGFGDERHSDLFLRPDPSTLAVLPWRPEHGRVVRMFCDIFYPDGKPFECDTRKILKDAVKAAKDEGIEFAFGSELEFYVFKLDENAKKTKEPYDEAGYLDMAPDDMGENVRREICLMLEQMGIKPETSHHEQGPGQNEIDFRYSDALSAADNAMTFKTVVKTVAQRNGLWADFSPKPLENYAGSAFHINISAKNSDGEMLLDNMIAGIMDRICDITAFLNTSEQSYSRFGKDKAPKYISWSDENRSQLIRVPAAHGEYCRAELRSADPMTNAYLAFALIIHAVIDAVKKNKKPVEALDINLYTADSQTLSKLKTLPCSLKEAVEIMSKSEFVAQILPEKLIEVYKNKLG